MMSDAHNTPAYDVVIVGSGPSGIGAALHLQLLAPELAARTLVLEKEFHPRHKLCGGGLTNIAQNLLGQLGLGEQVRVPFFAVHEICVRFEGRELVIKAQDIVKIVDRSEFDAALVNAARSRGVQVQEGTIVSGIEVRDQDVLLTTNKGQLRAKCVVAADGAKSTIRRQIGLDGPSRVARALEILTPEDPASSPEFHNHRLVIDFTPLLKGLQGYAWDFPSIVGDRPQMNRGVYDSRTTPEQPNAPLKDIFQDYLAERDVRLHDYQLKGNPGRWFDPQAQFSVPRVLLTGDAAGIEAFGGDGIGSSLWYGQVVAKEIVAAFENNSFTFAGYRDHLLSDPLGQFLTQRTKLAQRVYSLHNRYLLRGVWLLLRESKRFHQFRQSIRRLASKPR